jgi:putative membrane protein
MKSLFLKGLWGLAAAVFVWSAVAPKDSLTWALEVAPAVVGAALLVALRRRFRLTPLVQAWVALHMIVLMVGGHYTYAEVPLFDWIRDALDLRRNHYDRVGHFFQGFVPALLCREILVRRGVLARRAWLPFVVISFCLALSATYELIEWASALILGQGADAFLGTQGDPWDTQTDMFLAGVGAVLALACLGRVHDRELKEIAPAP